MMESLAVDNYNCRNDILQVRCAVAGRATVHHYGPVMACPIGLPDGGAPYCRFKDSDSGGLVATRPLVAFVHQQIRPKM